MCSWGGGNGFLCDPEQWQPAADAWTQQLDLAMGDDTFTPYLRTAFGDMYLWGQRTSPSLKIIPIESMVIPRDESDEMQGDEWDRDNLIVSTITTVVRDVQSLLDDKTSQPVFAAIRSRLGEVDADTMYSFAPVPALGGVVTPATAVIERAVPPVILLAALDAADAGEAPDSGGRRGDAAPDPVQG